MRWVIGDIHGMLRPLVALLETVRRRDDRPRFFFAGDYVNRGPDSRGVIDLLMSLPPDSAFMVRGNHDDVFDLVLNRTSFCGHPSCGEDPAVAFAWFMNHGLAETFQSYGVDYAELEHAARRRTHEALAKIATSVPDGHRKFVRNLPPVVHEPDLFVAHAMWDPDEPDIPGHMDRLLRESPEKRFKLLWGRYGKDLSRQKRWMRTGYFGHTPVLNYHPARENVPLVGPKIVLLDTAAALTPAGRLTAVCADTDELVQVDRQGNVAEGV